MEGVLAGLALATALKDLIELGVKLKEFCERVDNNNQELARLSGQVLSDLRGLLTLYRQDPVGMKQSPELAGAAADLKKKIETICDNFEKLAARQPKSNGGILVKLKAPFKASGIERDIRFLKEDVSSCYQYFQLLASAHINNKVNNITNISEDTQAKVAKVEGATGQIIVVVEEIRTFMTDQRTQIPDMKAEVQMQLSQYKSEALTSPNAQQLIPSRSSTLDSLTHQIDNLCIELPKVAAQPNSNEQRPPAHALIVRVPYFSFHRSRAQRNRRLLRKVLDLLENLEDDATAIEQHAFGLNLLVGYFGQSDMCGESLQVAIWAVDIYRLLVRINPQAFEPFLAKALGNLVHYRVMLGHALTETLSVIDEASTLIQPHAGPQSHPQLRYHFAWILATRAWTLGQEDGEEALKTLLDALKIFESILEDIEQLEDLFGALNHPDSLVEHLTSRVTERQQIAPPDAKDGQLLGYEAHLFVYQWALDQASIIHRSELNETESQEYLLKRGIVLAYLAYKYPDTNLDIKFAQYLGAIGQHLPEEVISTAQNILYLKESVRIFRKASRIDPGSYANEKFKWLKKLALLLESLEKREEAHEAWQEATDIDPSLVGGRFPVAYALLNAANNLRAICRYEEAAALRRREIELYHSPNEYNMSEADAYLELAADYKSCGRFQDALESARVAVYQFRELLLISPVRYPHTLAGALSSYFQLFAGSSAGNNLSPQMVKEVADQYDTLIRYDTSFLSHYLDTITTAISNSPSPEIAAQLNLDVIVRLQQLAQDNSEYLPKLQERLLLHGSLFAIRSGPSRILPNPEASRSNETLV